MSKEKPNKDDCPTGPDHNHVFQRDSADGSFHCVYCDWVQHFDIFDREWKK